MAPRDDLSRQRNPDVTYDMVQAHPDTGETHLFFSPQLVKSIDGLSSGEAQVLLDELIAEITRPEFVLRHRWQPGDIVLFDNRFMMHSATQYDYADQRRYLRQIIINGRALSE